MSRTYTRQEVVDIMNALEQSLVSKKRMYKYSKVRSAGTPYQSTDYYGFSYIEPKDVKTTIAAYKTAL